MAIELEFHADAYRIADILGQFPWAPSNSPEWHAITNSNSISKDERKLSQETQLYRLVAGYPEGVLVLTTDEEDVAEISISDKDSADLQLSLRIADDNPQGHYILASVALNLLKEPNKVVRADEIVIPAQLAANIYGFKAMGEEKEAEDRWNRYLEETGQ